MDAYDKYDYELCGTEKPAPVISDGPRLVMVFSSGELQGRGFKVKYIKRQLETHPNIKTFSFRENIHLKLNIEFQELQHRMEHAVLPTEAHPRREESLIHLVILRIIHLTQTVHSFFLQHQMNKSRSFLTTSK